MRDERSSSDLIGRLVASVVFVAALCGAVYGQDPSGRPPDPRGKKPPTGKRTPPETRASVLLTVLSDPPGSSVFINGEARGTTNAEGRVVLERLPLGHYSVEVRKDGFNSMVRGFDAGSDQPTLVFKLVARFDDVTKELLAAGIAKFIEGFDRLLDSLDRACHAVAAECGPPVSPP